CREIGSVYAPVLLCRNVKATKNSFHAVMKAKMLAAPSPGATRGMRMRQKTVHPLAPSIAAASSKDLGTAATKLRIMRMVIGKATATYTMKTPDRLLTSSMSRVFPKWKKLMNSEMISASTGTIWMTSSMMMNTERSLKRKRATATAARREISAVHNTEPIVTIRLLVRKDQKDVPGISTPDSTRSKCSKVISRGSRDGSRVKISPVGLSAVARTQ